MAAFRHGPAQSLCSFDEVVLHGNRLVILDEALHIIGQMETKKSIVAKDGSVSRNAN